MLRTHFAQTMGYPQIHGVSSVFPLFDGHKFRAYGPCLDKPKYHIVGYLSHKTSPFPIMVGLILFHTHIFLAKAHFWTTPDGGWRIILADIAK